MKITANTRTVFRFPTGLIANGLTTGIIRGQLKKEGIILTEKQTARLIKELKQYKETHPHWNLVEVDKSNGDTVKIKL